MADAKFDRNVFAEPWLSFLDELGESPALRGSVVGDLLKGWDTLLGKLSSKYDFPGPDESVKTEQHELENFWVRSYTPSEIASEDIGVFIHGGGWAMGSVDGEDAIARLLSKSCKMRMISVDYRLAPQHKYPVPLDDCVTATEWALKNFSQDKAVLIGGSAGGNLAFATALKLIDAGRGSVVQGIVALVPVTVHPNAVPANLKSKYTAYEEHAEHTVNTKSAMEIFFDAYGASSDDKYVSVLLHPRLKDLPRTYMTESGTDVLRDDARLMRDVLRQAGVEVKYDAYPGYPHYSWTFPSKLLASHQAEFFGNLIQGLDWVKQEATPKL